MSIIKIPFKFKTEIHNELERDFMKININGVPIEKTVVEVNFSKVFQCLQLNYMKLYRLNLYLEKIRYSVRMDV